MKKILMICEFFNPDNIIASVRCNNFAREFVKEGYEVDVICADNSYRFNQHKYMDDIVGLNVIKIKGDSISAKIERKLITKNVNNFNNKKTDFLLRPSQNKKSIKLKIKSFLSPYFYRVMSILKAHGFKKASLDFILSNLNIKEYSFMWSTYGDFGAHYIAERIKKKYKDIFWIADFRDSISKQGQVFPFKYYCNNYAMRTVKTANLITAVSQGVIDNTKLPQKIPKLVIENGFVLQEFTNDTIPNSMLTFAYCGVVGYNNKRRLDSFYIALAELEKRLGKQLKIVVEYYGSDWEEFEGQAKLYNKQNYLVNKGQVSITESQSAQKRANILLMASWNTKKEQGILTGKFFEYMSMKKPIICCVTGEVPNSKLKELIQSMKIGICVEDVVGVEDQNKLNEFLEQSYMEFLKNGNVVYNGDYEKALYFEFGNIVARLLSAVRNLI